MVKVAKKRMATVIAGETQNLQNKIFKQLSEDAPKTTITESSIWLGNQYYIKDEYTENWPKQLHYRRYLAELIDVYLFDNLDLTHYKGSTEFLNLETKTSGTGKYSKDAPFRNELIFVNNLPDWLVKQIERELTSAFSDLDINKELEKYLVKFPENFFKTGAEEDQLESIVAHELTHVYQYTKTDYRKLKNNSNGEYENFIGSTGEIIAWATGYLYNNSMSPGYNYYKHQEVSEGAKMLAAYSRKNNHSIDDLRFLMKKLFKKEFNSKSTHLSPLKRVEEALSNSNL